MAQNEDEIKINVDASQSIKSLADLKKALKDAKSAMLSTEEGTEEYNQALAEAARLQHQMSETTRQITQSQADFGQQLSNAAGVAAGFTGAIQAVNGALNVLGVDAEVGAEAIQKMQSMMAITQGFQAIDQAGKSFKGLLAPLKAATTGMNGFKKALMGTGIGLIVVAIAALISNFDDLKEALGIGEEETKKFGEAFNKLKEIWAGVSKVLVKGIINLAKIIKTYFSTIGKGITQLFKGDFSGMVDTFKNGFVEAAGYVKDTLNVTETYAEGVKKYNDKVAEEATKKAKEEAEKQAEIDRKKWEAYVRYTKQALDTELQLRESQEKEGWKLTTQGKSYMDEYFRQLEKLYDKDSNEYKQLLAQKNNYYKQYLSNQETLRKEAEVQRKTDEAVERKSELDELKNNLTQQQILTREMFLKGEIDRKEMDARLKQLDEDYTANYLQELRYQLDAYSMTEEEKVAIREKINTILSKQTEEPKTNKGEKEDDPVKHVVSNIEALNTAISEIDTTGFDKLYASIGQTVDAIHQANKAVKDGKKEYAGYAVAASAALGGVSAMLTDMANQQDRNTKEGFEKQKKYQTAAAVMSMLSGIALAISGAMTTKSGPWDIAIAAAQAATIATAGAIQIAKIQQTQLESSAASSSASVPQLSVGAMNAMTQTPEAITAQPDSTLRGMKDTKVYVLESDISTTQGDVRTTTHESSF